MFISAMYQSFSFSSSWPSQICVSLKKSHVSCQNISTNSQCKGKHAQGMFVIFKILISSAGKLLLSQIFLKCVLKYINL
jgi:hypothetical protein